jgi:pimeloyl-ACP methyl ester carboxylesterase
MGCMLGKILGAFFAIVVCSPALAQGPPNRPVILVPGILGSRLCDANGTVVWGTAKSFLNFEKLELSEDGLGHGITACGLIEEFQIMGSFWANDQYNTLMSSLSKLGYSPQQGNIYVFNYDWRISNYENARLLNEFITENVPAGRPFDIIAHSMGGIVSRIYMDKYAGSKSLARIVYLGTPFLDQ